MAYESPLTIADVVKDISANKYVLPSIQREFVWSTSQIEKLFDSVMQDYPFGAFLFWELSKDQNTLYDFYSFLQNYHEKNAWHNPKVNLTGNDNVMAVLDGQQRLAAIPNIEKQDKDFEEWFAEICPTDTDKIQYRKTNYLPEMQYSYVEFLQFVSDRRKKIKNQLKVELM